MKELENQLLSLEPAMDNCRPWGGCQNIVLWISTIFGRSWNDNAERLDCGVKQSLDCGVRELWRPRKSNKVWIVASEKITATIIEASGKPGVLVMDCGVKASDGLWRQRVGR